jgi:hypothetical protein
MESLELEKSLNFERKGSLDEVSKEIFELHDFGEDDVLLVDNDETLTPTWENFLLKKPFDNLREDTKDFLNKSKESNVPTAIVTNMPRENHYMNHTIPVFGYDHFFENKFLKKIEFPLTLFLGSLYKQTDKSLYEIAMWSLNNGSNEGKIAWVGNSYLDQGFGFRLEKILRKLDYKGDFYMYRLPMIRSFKKS